MPPFIEQERQLSVVFELLVLHIKFEHFGIALDDDLRNRGPVTRGNGLNCDLAWLVRAQANDRGRRLRGEHRIIRSLSNIRRQKRDNTALIYRLESEFVAGMCVAGGAQSFDKRVTFV